MSPLIAGIGGTTSPGSTTEKALAVALSAAEMIGQAPDHAKACPLTAAVQVIGERWTILILRAVFDGLHHYEEYHAELGIARNTLADRLARLVRCGVLSREGMPGNRRKVHYALTVKGAALLPTITAMRQWGETWESDTGEVPH